MAQRPRIADVQCTRLRFEPGDRVIVRSRHRLDNEQQRRLRASITKWAGVDIEVLIYCELDFSLEVQKTDRTPTGLLIPPALR